MYLKISLALVRSNRTDYLTLLVQATARFRVFGNRTLPRLQFRFAGNEIVGSVQYCRFALASDSMINMVMAYVTHTSIRGDR